MAKFNWIDHDNALTMLRSMGCAVVTITPEDIQTLTADDDDEPTLTTEQANSWMQLHYDDVEDAILGDYWGDTIRDLMSVFAEREEAA